MTVALMLMFSLNKPSGEFLDESDLFLSQDLLDFKEILEDWVSLGLQDRKDAKEIQAIGGTRVQTVQNHLHYTEFI